MDIKVSNTSGNAGGGNYVRVYLNNVLIAETRCSMRDPLAYIRQRHKSKYINDLWSQCRSYGMMLDEFQRYILNK